MSSQEVRSRILKVFKQIRKSPQAEFKDAYFMSYLLEPPSRIGYLKGSFRGARKYYSFINAIELEFGICFKNSDLDQEYSIDQLTEKIEKRIENQKGNKMIVKMRLEEKNSYLFDIFLAILLLTIVGIFQYSLVSAFAILLYALILRWAFSRRIADKRHNKKLYQLIIGQPYAKKSKAP